VVRPPILGLIKHPAQATEIQRNNARIGVALHAHREGFALVKTIELDGDDRADAVALKDLTDVAASRNVTASAATPRRSPSRSGPACG
jgi:hypothetical protein